MVIWVVSIILLTALYLLVTEKVPLDVTAIGTMVVLMITGILTPAEAVAGFSNPAVITVGAMFLISRGLVRTGAVSFLGRLVTRLAMGQAAWTLVTVLLLVSLASAFINNTPVVVLFIPVVMHLCCEFQLSPSRFLIPISYASILAGTCTLIGTSTNIIVSDLSAAAGYGDLAMFELSRVGLPIAMAGVLLMVLTASKWLPDLLNPSCELEDKEHRRYLAELFITRGSRLIDKSACVHFSRSYPGLELLELIRDQHIYHPCRDDVTLSAHDLLLVKGSANKLIEIVNDPDFSLPLAEKGLVFSGGEEASVVVEMIIPPMSPFLGQRLKETSLHDDPDLHFIAIKRSGLHFGERSFESIKLKIGDVLLMWCPGTKLDRIRSSGQVIIVEDVHHEIVHHKKAPIAGIIFVGLVIAATLGLADIMVCALTAVVLMVLTGCLHLRDAYRSLQGDILLLIAGTIALGVAMEKTGTSQYYAGLVLSALRGLSPRLILGGIILLTSISSHLLSNNATAALLLPVAISTALELGVNPKAFIIGVCLGASACFASPIGYQTNLLVYAPGGYRFVDYFKLGLPLNILVLVIGTWLIPIFWPL